MSALGHAGWIAAGEASDPRERLAKIAPLTGEAPAGGRPVRLLLPREIIAATSRRFADLRVFDDRGREIPYAIRGETVERPVENRFPFRVTGFEPESQTLTLSRNPGADTPYDRLEVKTGARNFRKAVAVSGSDDQQNWRELCRDMIFDFSARVGLRKTYLELAFAVAEHLARG